MQCDTVTVIGSTKYVCKGQCCCATLLQRNERNVVMSWPVPDLFDHAELTQTLAPCWRPMRKKECALVGQPTYGILVR